MVHRTFVATMFQYPLRTLTPWLTCAGLLLAVLVNLSLPATAQSRAEAQLSLRIDQLEERMRAMTGQIEQQNFEIRQLNEKLRRFSEDTEYRLQQIGPSANGRRSDFQPPAGPPPPTSQPSYSGGTINQAPNRSSATVGAQPAPLGTLSTESGVSGPLNINPGGGLGQRSQNFVNPNAPVGSGYPNPLTGSSGIAEQSPGQVAIGVPMDPRTEYDVAYSYILQRDYDSAESAFTSFLASHPGSDLTGNARYWLGESFYARGMYRPAADAFLKGYTENKRGQKAPDSLLKLGMSLVQLDQKQAACATFSELSSKYPNASPNVRQRAARESERARC